MASDLITSTILAVVAIVLGYDRYRTGNAASARETISLLKEALTAKDLKIAEMKTEHDTAIAGLQSDINSLRAQLDHLKEANSVLTNTVTGKENLLAITEILKPIPELFSPGGFIDEVKINQQWVRKELEEIKAALAASPAIVGPTNRPFKQRSPMQ